MKKKNKKENINFSFATGEEGKREEGGGEVRSKGKTKGLLLKIFKICYPQIDLFLFFFFFHF